MKIWASCDAVSYRCHNTGKCCKSFRVGVDPKKQEQIASRVEALGEYVGRDLFVPGVPGSFLNHRMLAREEDGACVFLRKEDLRCDLHARFGPSAKPLVCLQYPYVAVGHPDGVRVGLVYSCPSSVLTLRESARFEVVADPPGISLPAFTRGVPEDYPLWLAPGEGISWDRFHRIESELLARIQDAAVPLPAALYQARLYLGEVSAGPTGDPGPAELGLQARLVARLAERRGKLGFSSGRTDLALYRFLVGLAQGPPPPQGRGAWPMIEPDLEPILRRYLCGKIFANVLFIEQGVIPGYQGVLALYCLVGWVRRFLQAFKGADGLEGLCEAIEYTERDFPNEDRTFSLWSRQEAQYEMLDPFYARVLLA